MGFDTTIAGALRPASPSVSIWAQGDGVWAEKAVSQRESDVAMAWPEDQMAEFCLQMASHRMPINRFRMLCERRYAVQQLMAAYTTHDGVLHRLAAALFFHFEEQQHARSPMH